jgi:hypothetical protein
MSEPNDMREEACAEFRKRFNGFDDQSTEYIAKHFGAQLDLLSEILAALLANREKDAEIAEEVRLYELTIKEAVGARDEFMKQLDIANAEIARLKEELEYLKSSDNWRVFVNGLPEIVAAEDRAEKAEAELSSLSASAGEKWVEIKEGCELPPERDDNNDTTVVLVYSPKYPTQHLGRYRSYDRTWTFIGSNSDWTKEITHWMPMVAPPSTEKES